MKKDNKNRNRFLITKINKVNLKKRLVKVERKTINVEFD
jgi:hypothetical protein